MENLSFVNVFLQVAASLSEALAAIRSHTFDVVLSDLNINAEGDGFTVIYAAHEANPGCVNDSANRVSCLRNGPPGHPHRDKQLLCAGRGCCVTPQHHRTEAARSCFVGVASEISRSL